MEVPHPFKQMRDDLQAAKERDPAARSALEVALLYPGLHALWSYRVSHALWTNGVRFPARAIQSTARFFTGVDIHPGATIGDRLFIDHAMGVVVGETAEIGDDVLIFHEVTLGGVTMTPGKRHPTVGDRVILGAGAKVLGPVTVGSDAKVGANAVVVKDIPEKGVAVGVPSHLRGTSEERGTHTHGTLPARLPADSREACTALETNLEASTLEGEITIKPGQDERASDVGEVSVKFKQTYVHEDGVMVEPALYI